MDADSLGAKNLFARITSFTAEAGSDRIENLCTEVLAWCVLRSKGFRQAFFKCFGVVDIDGAEIYTQFPVEIPKDRKGFCDLVILPANHRRRGIALIVELKVWSAFREGQLSDYRRALKKKMQFLEPRIVTVTPFRDLPPGSDHHVTWSEIGEVLERTAKTDDAVVLSEFAAFLRSRGMNKPVVIDRLDSATIGKWRTVAEKVGQFNSLFALLTLDKSLKGIFAARELDRPKLEYDDVGRAWLGVFTSGSPWYYAGIGVLPNGDAVLWVQVALSGDKRAKRLPGSLREDFAHAKAYATADR